MPKRKAHVEDEIIAELAKGPRKKLDVRNAVIETCDVTPQAFYKVFATLRKKEIVTVSKDIAALSAVWVQHERARLERVAEAYGVSGHTTYVAGLKKGERRTYKFKTLRELDLFWVHIVLMTMQGTYRNKAILSLLPHHWFDILRPETNEVWYRLLGKDVPHYNVLTHATSAEKKYMHMQEVRKNELMFGVNPLKQKESVYYNVIGDLVFEAHVDEWVLPHIRSAMRGDTYDRNRLLDRKGDFRLSIARNEAKATAIRRKVQKYFTIPIA